MKTNYDICCESIEKMEQFIDIMKCGWTKEQILSWLKQPSRETEEKQKIRVCYLSDIPFRLKNSRIILEKMEARHIIKKYKKGFVTWNTEYCFIDCRNIDKCSGLYADQAIIDYRYPMTEIAKKITAISCVPERWRIIDDRSIDTSGYLLLK